MDQPRLCSHRPQAPLRSPGGKLTRLPTVQSLKSSGREQNLEGQRQEARGQANDFVGGISDRVTGTLGSAAAGLTGDRAKQAEYQDIHDTGKTQQRGAEHDIQKQADAAAAANQQK